MFELSLFWIALGIALGALANGARWGLRARGFAGWQATLSTLGIGAAGAVLVGWLGVFVFGRPFGTPAALWGGVLAAVLLPWLLALGRDMRSKPFTGLG
jgi:cell shape-determining protein MreD